MLRVHTLSVVFTAGHSEKEDPRVMARKANVHDQVFDLGLKGKGYVTSQEDDQDSAL